MEKFIDTEVSLYFKCITFGYNQWCPRLHLEKHLVQAIPSKKKKEGDKGERQNEKRTGKREVENRRRGKEMEGV